MFLLFLFLILIFGSVTAFVCLFHSLPEKKLLPLAVLPVPDSSPESKAFLNYYASQIIWMDSEILDTILLIYPENAPDVQQLCEEFSRQYDFFKPVAFSEAGQFLKSYFKNSEIF